jgi:hypothetical protein
MIFMMYSYNRTATRPSGEKYFNYLDNTGTMGFARLFTEWQHRFSDDLSVNTGSACIKVVSK